MKSGTEVEVAELAALLKKEVCNKKITFSGGEPLMQAEALLVLVKLLDGFDIAIYTGHELCDVPAELLDRVNYIKTGSFREELKTTVKPFVGSTNQEFRRLR
jgi:organic radical activating enzyme